MDARVTFVGLESFERPGLDDQGVVAQRRRGRGRRRSVRGSCPASRCRGTYRPWAGGDGIPLPRNIPAMGRVCRQDRRATGARAPAWRVTRPPAAMLAPFGSRSGRCRRRRSADVPRATRSLEHLGRAACPIALVCEPLGPPMRPPMLWESPAKRRFLRLHEKCVSDHIGSHICGPATVTTENHGVDSSILSLATSKLPAERDVLLRCPTSRVAPGREITR